MLSSTGVSSASTRSYCSAIWYQCGCTGTDNCAHCRKRCRHLHEKAGTAVPACVLGQRSQPSIPRRQSASGIMTTLTLSPLAATAASKLKRSSWQSAMSLSSCSRQLWAQLPTPTLLSMPRRLLMAFAGTLPCCLQLGAPHPSRLVGSSLPALSLLRYCLVVRLVDPQRGAAPAAAGRPLLLQANLMAEAKLPKARP